MLLTVPRVPSNPGSRLHPQLRLHPVTTPARLPRGLMRHVAFLDLEAGA